MPHVDREGEIPGKLAVYVYADHPPPHFHVRSTVGDVVIDLATLQVMRGRIIRRDRAAVLDWAALNRARLWDAWRAMNGRD